MSIKDGVLRLRHTKPIWMQDYAPGFSLFTYKQDSIISQGIAWFMDMDAPLQYAELLKEGFKKGLSHVISVETAVMGLEATVGGIQRCDLTEIFEDPQYMVVCREPADLTDISINEKLAYQKTLLGNNYDYGIFPWFAVMSLTGIQNVITSLKKMKPIGHKEGARVCSTYEADGFYNTKQYHDIKLFQEWNVLGIHVNRLFLDFPYKPFRFDKVYQREWL